MDPKIKVEYNELNVQQVIRRGDKILEKDNIPLKIWVML